MNFFLSKSSIIGSTSNKKRSNVQIIAAHEYSPESNTSIPDFYALSAFKCASNINRQTAVALSKSEYYCLSKICLHLKQARV